MHRMHLIAAALLLFGSGMSSSWSAPIPEAVPSFSPTTPHCLLTIRTTTTGGQVETQEFHLPAKSDRECQKLAVPHKTVFDPGRVRKKTVEARFMRPIPQK